MRDDRHDGAGNDDRSGRDGEDGRAGEDLSLRRCGDAALLAEVPGLDAAIALHTALAASWPDGVVDLVPAARTVLVRFDPRRTTIDLVARWTRERAAPALEDGATSADAAGEDDDEPVTVEVVYDGEDLDEVAELTGLSRDGVVAAHTETRWRVAFAGFAPGFGYLVPVSGPAVDGRLEVPRRDESRSRIPAGAVGLAGGFSGVYPRASPGGWRLIGRTGATLFDPDRDPPALLRDGTVVRFAAGAGEGGARDHERPARRGAGPPAPGASDASPAADAGPAADARPAPADGPPADRPGALVVEHPGLRTLIQDLGRPGRATIGVGPSGAADRGALRLANRLVGNHEGEAALETLAGGLRLCSVRRTLIAVTGATGPILVDGEPVGANAPVHLRDGQTLELGSASTGPQAGSGDAAGSRTPGLYAYVAVRGGLDVTAVLGSRSRDTLADLGPPPVEDGDELAAGTRTDGWPTVGLAPVATPPEGDLVLRVRLGPREQWFTADALALLTETVWTVSADVDRVGARLDGPTLERAREGELPSEGLVRGAVQVPTSGRPVLFLADHPLTGGYPVIAVVVDGDLDRAAQAHPGRRLLLRSVDGVAGATRSLLD